MLTGNSTRTASHTGYWLQQYKSYFTLRQITTSYTGCSTVQARKDCMHDVMRKRMTEEVNEPATA